MILQNVQQAERLIEDSIVFFKSLKKAEIFEVVHSLEEIMKGIPTEENSVERTEYLENCCPALNVAALNLAIKAARFDIAGEKKVGWEIAKRAEAIRKISEDLRPGYLTRHSPKVDLFRKIKNLFRL
jgi:hypothetical protein